MDVRKAFLGLALTMPYLFGSQSEAQENDQCLPFMLRGSELTELIQGNHRQEFVNILSQFSNDVRAPEVLQGILDDLTDKDLANGEFFEEGGLMIPCEIQKDGDWHVQLHTRDTNPKTASVIDIPVSPKKIVDLYAILDTVSK